MTKAVEMEEKKAHNQKQAAGKADLKQGDKPALKPGEESGNGQGEISSEPKGRLWGWLKFRKQDDTKKNPETREEKRKFERKQKRRLRVRLVPIWLRLIIILVLCALALIAGAMIGFGILGKGNPMDVFDSGTWSHVWDIVFKNT